MKKRLLSLFLAALMLMGILSSGITAAEGELPFDDVPETEWFYSSIKYAYENGLMNGIGGAKFDPNGKMNRAMFVTILGRFDGAAEVDKNSFPDVVKNEDSKWYYGYVGWAAENGIVTGDEHGFRPNDFISREEAVTAITRYIKYTGIEPLKKASAPTGFTDEDKLTWSKEYVDYMRLLGIVNGKENGEFDPTGTLTRAEAATILQRMKEMFNYLALEESITPDYRPEGEDFYLMGAYQLYYSGTALTTGYNGTQVDTEGELPMLVNDPDGRKVSHFYQNPENTVAKGNYFGLDMKVACIDPNEYPIVRIGYKSDSNMAATLSVYAGDASREYFDSVPNVSDGIDIITANLKEDGAWAETLEQVVVTVCSSQGTELEIAYIAFFKNAEEANAFSVADYKDYLTSYNGEEIFYEKMDEEMLSGILSEADKKADAIINNTKDIDPSTIKGTVYYISSENGDDKNDGLSPNTAWKSLSKLERKRGPITESILVAGDAVLFERGSVFYPEKTTVNSGNFHGGFEENVTYGAYGDGPKPVFTTAVKHENGSKTGSWTLTDAPNVYVLDQVFEVPDGSAVHYNDIANIVFDRGEAWGIKVTFGGEGENPIGKTTSKNGMVTNGIDYYYEGGVVFEGYKSLTNNLEYWLDFETQRLYLCSKNGDPDVIFEDIVITKKGSAMYAGGENTLIDNIAFYGVGTHAIDAANVTNLKIQNCTFEWIGGAGMGERLGNAIQNWNDCDGFFVVDCYIDQVYDAGITTQGNGMMKNNEYSGNVIKNCNMSIELFNGSGDDSCMTNIIARDNYILYSGFGFGHQRPQGNMTGSAFLGSKGWATKTSNVIFENNYNIYVALFAFGSAGMARGENAEGIIMRNNTYLMDPDTGYCARGVNNMIGNYGNNKTLLPYTEQYIQYLADIGIERGTKYYYYDGYLFPEEEFGVYYDYYEYVK